MRVRSYIASAAATALLAVGSAALAQGSTTGPATGGNVEPSTATQKQNPANPAGGGAAAGQGTENVSGGGAVSAGAPGSPARAGTQGGPPPQQGTSAPK